MKKLHFLAGTGVGKNSTVASGSSPIKIHFFALKNQVPTIYILVLNTVKPVLAATCIKQATCLKQNFHYPFAAYIIQIGL